MARPRLLLVAEFTELEWAIKPELEEWAEVLSFDPPGVGTEPVPAGMADLGELTREIITTRGPRAETAAVEEPPSASPSFAEVLRRFCERHWPGEP